MLKAFYNVFPLKRSHSVHEYPRVESFVRMHYRSTMPIVLDGEVLPQSYLVHNIRFLELYDDSIPQQQCLRGTLLHGDSLATFETLTANGETTLYLSGPDRNSRLQLPLTMYPERTAAIVVPQSMSMVPFSIPNEYVIALLLAIYTYPYHASRDAPSSRPNTV